MMRILGAAWLIGLLLMGPVAHACRVCRPRVQAQIHTPDYTANLLILLLPIAVVLLVGAGLYFAPALKPRPSLPARS
ncbi:hypothetical protein DNI29_13290 [Hymenobacter sediminis]|uniref:hypothetical protein n=1 Tax=Hymenobacter sediminis TaxID=2218621 RepID=UPI000F509E57|nr:hypothetical protein [Hymenobacter sediminis]RPD47118.1 hypothetical protein DNI29_13290 [Hymenobacter sediminis]